MNRSFPILSILVAIALFATTYGALVVQAYPAARAIPKAATYENVLGKSLDDKDVADFIASNKCSPVDQLQVCSAAGMALVMDNNKKIDSVFLYPENANGFAAYQGQLPFGISFADTMESVEAKLGHPVEIHAPQAGWVSGLPDEGFSPDHFHYNAIYRRFGMTVIYNSPSAADKNATIYTILVNK